METLDLSIIIGFTAVVAGVIFYYYYKFKSNEQR
jgi:hypothetical protein